MADSKRADFSLIKKGILEENPVYTSALALCPTLAVTVTAVNGLGMGIATTAVLTASCLLVSLLRNVIPNAVRIPIFILICASFTTVVQFLLQAYLPALNDALGMFIALIAINCIILARMESFSSKNPALNTTFDAIGMGLGFTLALIIIGIIREFIGGGAFLGFALPEAFPRTTVLALPPGGFFVLAFVIVIFTKFRDKFFSGKPKPAKVAVGGGCASAKACPSADCPAKDEGGSS
ncbi:MAG: electron transport complex subunit RsxE [Clostridiales bacterium]|jgi:electron transport complex protein RnfE|nr:electron transport complex subunit RsxE [Clostridiales bacterium]